MSDGAPRDGRSIADAYDRWSATYDQDANTTRDLDAEVLRAASLPLAGADVVELGCGTGKNTAWIAAHARSVVALDFSAGMLARARRRVAGDHVCFVQHDLRDPWPLPERSADVVVGNLVLEHVERLGPVFSEAARVLRPGGALFLCELHPERQRRGTRAQFDGEAGGRERVASWQHEVSDFVNEGIDAGLHLARLGEWLEPDAPADAPPRLLSVRFDRPAG